MNSLPRARLAMIATATVDSSCWPGVTSMWRGRPLVRSCGRMESPFEFMKQSGSLWPPPPSLPLGSRLEGLNGCVQGPLSISESGSCAHTVQRSALMSA
jgi:hypothetical protein